MIFVQGEDTLHFAYSITLDLQLSATVQKPHPVWKPPLPCMASMQGTAYLIVLTTT